MNSTFGNLVVFLICVALAAAAGAVGHSFPKAVVSVTDTVVTSLSIIFGLSMAVYSLASRKTDALRDNRPNDPLIEKQVKKDIASGNSTVLARQSIMLSLFLISIMLGIALKVTDKIPEALQAMPVMSGLFSFTSTLSLLAAFFLPVLLLKLHQTNQHFGLE